jgi:hypothetical protein
MPKISSTDAASADAQELIHALVKSSPASPLSHIGDDQLATLDQLANKFVTQGSAQLPRVRFPPPAAALALRVATTSLPTYDTTTINPDRRRRIEQNYQDQQTATVPQRTNQQNNLVANLACATTVLAVLSERLLNEYRKLL